MAKPTEFQELETFFSKAATPATIHLDSGTYVPDVPQFVKGYLDSLRSGEMAEKEAEGRMYRLRLLKKLLEKG